MKAVLTSALCMQNTLGMIDAMYNGNDEWLQVVAGALSIYDTAMITRRVHRNRIFNQAGSLNLSNSNYYGSDLAIVAVESFERSYKVDSQPHLAEKPVAIGKYFH